MRWLWIGLLFFFVLGCAAPGYRVDPKQYRSSVRTLGVLPILVDPSLGSDLPRTAELRSVVVDQSRNRAGRMVEMLRAGKGYFDVRLVSAEPEGLFSALVSSVSRQGEGAPPSKHYGFDAGALRKLADDEAVDALLVMIFYDQSRPEKKWSRGGFDYLESEFISLFVSAQVLAPSGELLWELPSDDLVLALQYADFDHAHFNRQDEVRTISISAEGLARSLSRTASQGAEKEEFPLIYQGLFRRVQQSLSPGLLGSFGF